MRTEAAMKGLGILAMLVVLALPACGSAGDEASKFAGPWTFQSGTLTPVCVGLPITPPPFSLAGLALTLTKESDSTVKLVAGSEAMCSVKFDVSGSKATAKSGQTCTLNVGGSFGEQTFGIGTWTLTLVDDHLESTLAGTVLVCSVSGSGVLVRGAPDGGTVSAADAASDGSDAGASETSAD